MTTQAEISAKMQHELKDGPYACASLVNLTGGTANFVYRATLEKALPDGSQTVVIKHTEGYVASNPNFKLTSTRCNFEQSILTSLDNLSPSTHANITVSTPHLYHFDSNNNIQIYTDLPSSTELKTYCLTHALTAQDCSHLGQSLGLWAKKFHTWGAAPEQAALREVMRGNTAMRDLKYQINYPHMITTISEFPEILEGSKSIFEAVAKDVRESLDRGEGTLIHGDFWTGNILLPNGPFRTSQTQPLALFIIDWELSHLGSIAFDLGQILAELYELTHFKDLDAGIYLIEAFIRGYGKLSQDLAFRTAIHFGAHLICWGSRVPGWGSKEQVQRVVRLGRDFVNRAYGRDEVWLGMSVLRCLL